MTDPTLALLLATAASLGVVHTAAGPDHYVPFIALSRASRWSLHRTLVVTALCGVGHVLGSVGLGALGIAFGWTIGTLTSFDGARGDIAGWLLTGFGFTYLVWGIRAAIRSRPHMHLHAHADGTVHTHAHTHDGEHMHVHAEAGSCSSTPWALFLVFAFGPCEPLIPLLMYPAAAQSFWNVALVSLVFGVATLITMMAAVLIGCSSLRLLTWRGFERYTHALAGAALTACGLAITFGL